MPIVLPSPSEHRIVKQMKRHAETGIFDGQNTLTRYFLNAHRHHGSGATLLFTRDAGMHECGWFKNPDYDRCYHLSISFWNPLLPDNPRPFETKEARRWCDLFYGDWTRYIWEESMFKRANSPAEVRHYRVMCNRAWQPIIPRGEVYSKDFIERGWQSWSDQQHEKSNQKNDGTNS